MQYNAANSNRVFITMVFLFAGWIAGQWQSPSSVVVADERGKTKLAFQSGSERSVAILQKISKQLESLENRVATIEKVVSKAATKLRVSN